MPRKIKSSHKPYLHPINNPGINFLDYYDEEKIRAATTFVTTKFTESKTFRTGLRADWIEYYMAYRGQSDFYKSRPTWQSAVWIPKTLEFIETKKPRMMQALFDVPPLFTAVPNQPQYIESGVQWEYYLDTLTNRMGYYLTHHEIVTEQLIYGTSIAKLKYDNNDSFDGYTGTRVVPCDLFDVYPDPSGKDIPSCKFVIHREIKHIEEIKWMEKRGLYKNVDKLKAGDSQTYFSNIDRLKAIGQSRDEIELNGDMHETLEYHGWWVDKDTKERFDVIMVVIDRATMVRFEETPYVVKTEDESGEYEWALKPFIQFWDIKLPHEFYGMGECELMRDLQLQLNDFHNLISDAAMLSLAPVYQAQVNALVNKNAITFEPGSVIETYYPDALKPLQRDFGWMQGMVLEDRYSKELEAVTGMFSQLRGELASRTVKATEHMSLVEESNARVKQCIQMDEVSSLMPMAKMIQMMEMQFTTDEVFAIVRGDENVEFMKLNPSTMKYDGAFILQVSSLYGQKGVMAQRRKDLIMMAIELAKAGYPMPIDMAKAFKLWGQAIDIKDKSLFEPPQANPMSGVPQLPRLNQPNPEEAAGIAAQGQGGGGQLPSNPSELFNIIKSEMMSQGAGAIGGAGAVLGGGGGGNLNSAALGI